MCILIENLQARSNGSENGKRAIEDPSSLVLGIHGRLKPPSLSSPFRLRRRFSPSLRPLVLIVDSLPLVSVPFAATCTRLQHSFSPPFDVFSSFLTL